MYDFRMNNDTTKEILSVLRIQVEELIRKEYKTIEEFCWHKNINKATMSNFLNNKKDFQISTLNKLARALNKKLSIKLV